MNLLQEGGYLPRNSSDGVKLPRMMASAFLDPALIEF